MVCDPDTVMLRPLLHWTTYEAAALPLGASHIRATVQSVTPVTRRFFGAAPDCRANAAFELPRGTSPNKMATMHVDCNASFRMEPSRGKFATTRKSSKDREAGRKTRSALYRGRKSLRMSKRAALGVKCLISRVPP